MKRPYAPQKQTAQERALWHLTHNATKLPQKHNGTHCMLWKGAFGDKDKYRPIIHWRHKRYNFLRFYLENVEGKVKTEGMEVCHNCNTKGCANPLHVRYGTHQSNMQDAVRVGTHKSQNQQGEKNSSAKLTQKQVNAIRQQYNKGGTAQKTLAKEYGISQAAISQILNNRTYV